MKRISKNLKKLLILFALIAAFSVFGITVAASEELDLTADGSISVTFVDSSTNEAVPGGVVNIYQVAELSETDAGLSYIFTDEFADCELSLTDLESNSFIADLNSYVTANNITGISATADNAGKCTFSDLPLGVYLVMQKQAVSGYYTVTPFIVTIPMTDEDGYVYDVDATPKMESVTPIPESSSTPSPPTPSSSTPSPPTPSSSSNPDNDVNGDDDNDLPQTGQLNWPIPVLAGGGILIFFLGWVLTQSRKKKNV